MSYITVESLGIEAGDQIEAAGQNGEIHRGEALFYNGLVFVGKVGRSVDTYLTRGYTVTIVEKAPKPIDKPTVARINDFLRKHFFVTAAEMIEEEFGEIDAF